MNLLPLELVNRILEYAGKMKCRNGKYMNQIDPDDDRYTMLKNMPKIIPNVVSGWSIHIPPLYNSSGKKYKRIYYNKYVCSWTYDKPYITTRIDGSSDYYNFSQNGYCYNMSVYHIRC